MKLVVQDEQFEFTAEQILDNVSDRTPPEFLHEVHAHADDEMRGQISRAS